jgi:hypothetical protein
MPIVQDPLGLSATPVGPRLHFSLPNVATGWMLRRLAEPWSLAP